MILTVTLNPLLENRLTVYSIELGETYRAGREFFTAGGKGINVSRQLNYLSVPNHALTFLGGENGKLLRKILSEEKIDLNFIQTKSETRRASLILEEASERITTFISPNNLITETESVEFRQKMEKMIRNCSMVVFAGSSPSPNADDIFAYGIKTANELDKISILDTYGSHLEKCIEASPTVVHNNITELQNSLNIDLSAEENKIDFLKHLYAKGIKMAFLTDGQNEIYASKFDYHYRITPPKVKTIDTTGSGDSFVAGIIFGLHHSLVFDEFVKIAAALGAANAAKLETCNVTEDEYRKYINGIQIQPIGKKMKIIDDSPNYIS